MKCPVCHGENVREMGMQTAESQMDCEDCGFIGTYTEFGVNNTGLVHDMAGAVLIVEAPMYAHTRLYQALAVTAHVVDGQTVANFWWKSWDQWVKYSPERVIDEPPSDLVLIGQINAFVQEPGREGIMSDFQLSFGLKDLMDRVIWLSRSEGSTSPQQ